MKEKILLELLRPGAAGVAEATRLRVSKGLPV